MHGKEVFNEMKNFQSDTRPTMDHRPRGGSVATLVGYEKKPV